MVSNWLRLLLPPRCGCPQEFQYLQRTDRRITGPFLACPNPNTPTCLWAGLANLEQDGSEIVTGREEDQIPQHQRCGSADGVPHGWAKGKLEQNPAVGRSRRHQTSAREKQNVTPAVNGRRDRR